MKRVYKSKLEPEALRKYRLRFPEETWEHFRRRCRFGYKEVKQEILHDHLQHCVAHAFHAGSEKDRQIKIDELLEVLDKRR